jgi:hypothetical protein
VAFLGEKLICQKILQGEILCFFACKVLNSASLLPQVVREGFLGCLNAIPTSLPCGLGQKAGDLSSVREFYKLALSGAESWESLKIGFIDQQLIFNGTGIA